MRAQIRKTDRHTDEKTPLGADIPVGVRVGAARCTEPLEASSSVSLLREAAGLQKEDASSPSSPAARLGERTSHL